MSQMLNHNTIYVNGLQVDLSGASFNIFDVFAKLTLEMSHLRSLSTLPVSSSVKSKIMNLAMTVTSSSALASSRIPDIKRIDVSIGSKRVFVFMNNLEKDSMYSNWPDSIRQLLMPAWSLHSIAKNMYTVIMIVDPFTEDGMNSVTGAWQMVQQQFPVRFGVVLYPGNDAPPRPETKLSETSEATRLHVAELFAFAKEYISTSSAISFLLNLFEEMMTSANDSEGNYSVKLRIVLNAFAKAIKKKESRTKEELIKLGMSILTHEVLADAKYSKKITSSDYRDVPELTSKYIQDRNLPMNSFSLNGIVVPEPEELYSELMQLLGREQYILSAAVQSGAISDNTPSIFAALMEPGKSFPRFHSVLFETETEYIDTTRPVISNALSDIHYIERVISPDAIIMESIILIFRFDSAGIQTVASALDFISSVDSPFRLALVPIDLEVGHENLLLLFTILTEEAQIILKEDEPNLSAIFSLLTLFDSIEGEKCILKGDCNVINLVGESDPLHDHLSDLLSTWKTRLQICESDPTMHPISSAKSKGASLLGALGFSPENDVLILNGRVFHLKQHLVVEDFNLFHVIESDRITKRLLDILAEDINESKQVLSPDAIVDITSFCGRYSSSSKSRIDVSSMLKGNNMDTSGMDYMMEILPKGDNLADSEVSIIFIVDPLTIAAQRAVAVMRLVNEELRLPFSLILVPLSRYESFPLQNFYRFVLNPSEDNPFAEFQRLPRNHVLTVRPDVPESWNTQAIQATQDIDNLKCDSVSCGDTSKTDKVPYLSHIVYKLKNILVAGQCYEKDESGKPSPPKGLQLLLSTNTSTEMIQTDSLVMQNYGYFQLKANPGLWYLTLAGAQARQEFSVDDSIELGKPIFVDSFVSSVEKVNIRKRPSSGVMTTTGEKDSSSGVWSTISSLLGGKTKTSVDSSERIHVFSLATGHMYERLLRIMMLSVIKRTSIPVKFWLFENYLSPTFKTIAAAMSKEYGFEIGYVTFKWPEWLTPQTEKQRIIWGYKILFLDVMFPLDVKKIIYIDADQIMRADLKELWNIDMKGKPYAYTPFCSSREDTLGYQFWRSGFWASHLQGRPYHISALYVVDLEVYRKKSYGDQLRAVYDGLARDPNSLANLDQDLPNYAQHSIPIHSLPQEWLWCESWCSESSKAAAKTIDLCNNPLHKEPKLDMARRIISGSLFNESWVELDEEIRKLQVAVDIA